MTEQWDDKGRKIAAEHRIYPRRTISLSYADMNSEDSRRAQAPRSLSRRPSRRAGVASAKPNAYGNLGAPEFCMRGTAHCFRLRGTIAYKAEAEQAFVIHWLVCLY